MVSRRVRCLGIALSAGTLFAASSVLAQGLDTPPPPPARTDSVAVAFPAPTVRRWQVGLLRPDRLQHASLSMTLGLAVGLITRKASIAACSSLTLGLAKELYDVRGTGFDPVDLCADGLGAAAAALGTRFSED